MVSSPLPSKTFPEGEAAVAVKTAAYASRMTGQLLRTAVWAFDVLEPGLRASIKACAATARNDVYLAGLATAGEAVLLSVALAYKAVRPVATPYARRIPATGIVAILATIEAAYLASTRLVDRSPLVAASRSGLPGGLAVRRPTTLVPGPPVLPVALNLTAVARA